METLTEKEAAEFFVLTVLKGAEKSLPELLKSLGDTFKPYNFKVKDEEQAATSLAIVVLVLELQCLKNIFPDRAESIYEKVLEITPSEYKLEFDRRIKFYQDKYHQSLEQYARNPEYGLLEEVAVQLLKDWFGEDTEQFYLKNLDKYFPSCKEKVVDPCLAEVLSAILARSTGFWKGIKNEYLITD